MFHRLTSVSAALLAGVALAAACTTDHGSLSKRDWGSGGTVAGEGGSASTGNAGTGGGEDAAPDAPTEPSGSFQFRVLNGVVDTDRVSLCFRVKLESGADAWLGAPSPAGGLAYGSTLDLSKLPWKPDTQGFETFAFAGQLELLASLDCARALDLAQETPQGNPQDAGGAGGSGSGGAAAGGVGGLAGAGTGGAGAGGGAAGGAAAGGAAGSGTGGAGDAGVPDASAGSAGASSTDAGADTGGDASGPPPVLRWARLGMIPPGSLLSDRSYLMLLSGCMGGPSFSDPSQETICGKGYSDVTPTLTNSVVELSRITQTMRVGVQFFNGSAAAGESDLLSVPTDQASGSPVTIASRIVFGRIAPRPPNLDYPASSYGSPLSAVELQVFAYGATAPGVTTNWQAALGNSSLENEKNFTLVLIGPNPGFAQLGWWQAPRVVALANDP
ncbi:MAG: hypothetical protein AB7K71_06975 [Polyangiaceae bacterium]